MLSGKVSKFSITFMPCVFPDSAPYSVCRVLRDRRQPKSESVLKALPFGHCIAMIITFSLFIRIERMSNEWKVEKVNYEFGIPSFMR
jgi:hypothetical protein